MNNDEIECYHVSEFRHGQVMYKQVDQIEEHEFRQTVAEMKPNKLIVTHCMFLPNTLKVTIISTCHLIIK